MNKNRIDSKDLLLPQPYTHGSLFSGIGGFDLAAEWMGWENVFHCEKSEFCLHLLNYYWPNAKTYKDIKKADFSEWRGKIDVLSGGFPCQPYSLSGKRLGKADDRHLWPYMLKAIEAIQPRWVLPENVPGIINWNDGLVFEEMQTQMEAIGYEVVPFVLPAASICTPHRRDRVWFISHRIITNPDCERVLKYQPEVIPNEQRINQGKIQKGEKFKSGIGDISEKQNATYAHSKGGKVFRWNRKV